MTDNSPKTAESAADDGRWPYSEMETFFPDDRPSWREPCEVRIAGGQITVSHRDPDLGPVTLRGEEAGKGHYRLHAANGARLTLHRFAGSERLEGSWTDRGFRGTWTITLSDDPEDAVA